MSWQHVANHTVMDCPEFYCDLDEYRDAEDRQMMFIHFAVRKLSASTLKRMHEAYRLFRSFVSCPLYAVAGQHDGTKWEKFVSQFGFRYLTDVVCENGEKRRLFVSLPGAQEEEQQRHVQLEPVRQLG